MNRRHFLKLLGMTLIIPEIKLDDFIPPTSAPATTNLGKSLASMLWPEGWHKVRIVNIEMLESKLHPESMNFWFTFESLDTKQRIKKVFSDRAATFLYKFVTERCTILPIHDSLDLTECIGKTVDVKIETRTYNNRLVNSVE